jgi:hypothetical protein
LKIALFASVSLLTQTNAKSKNVNKNSRPKRKPSLIVFNEKSSYKESDSQKSIQRAIRSKRQFQLYENKKKDKLGFTKSFNYSIRAKSGVFYFLLHSKSGKLESMSGVINWTM